MFRTLTAVFLLLVVFNVLPTKTCVTC